MLRGLRVALTWTLVFLMSFDVASACRWWHRPARCGWTSSAVCRPVIVDCNPCPQYPTVEMDCCEAPACCGAGHEVVVDRSRPADTHEPALAPGTAQPHETQRPPAETSPALEPPAHTMQEPPFALETPPSPDETSDSQPTPDITPLPPVEPAELPAEMPAEVHVPMPEETPAAEPPPIEPAPAAEEPIEMPAETPTPEPAEPSAVAPSEQAPPAEPPQDDLLQDLFGEPNSGSPDAAAAEPADASAAEPADANAAEPAEGEPSDAADSSLDDFLEMQETETPTEAAPETEAPAASSPQAGSPATESPATSDEDFALLETDEPQANDATPASAQDPAPAGDGDAATEATAAPAEEIEKEPAADQPAADENLLEDLFDPGTDSTSSDRLNDAGGLASRQTRVWSDDTGRFSCSGRLIEIEPDRIRLLKENGRTATVPIERLSLVDLRFVRMQTLASLHRGPIAQVAAHR